MNSVLLERSLRQFCQGGGTSPITFMSHDHLRMHSPGEDLRDSQIRFERGSKGRPGQGLAGSIVSRARDRRFRGVEPEGFDITCKRADIPKAPSALAAKSNCARSIRSTIRTRRWRWSGRLFCESGLISRIIAMSTEAVLRISTRSPEAANTPALA